MTLGRASDRHTISDLAVLQVEEEDTEERKVYEPDFCNPLKMNKVRCSPSEKTVLCKTLPLGIWRSSSMWLIPSLTGWQSREAAAESAQSFMHLDMRAGGARNISHPEMCWICRSWRTISWSSAAPLSAPTAWPSATSALSARRRAGPARTPRRLSGEGQILRKQSSLLVRCQVRNGGLSIRLRMKSLHTACDNSGLLRHSARQSARLCIQAQS